MQPVWFKPQPKFLKSQTEPTHFFEKPNDFQYCPRNLFLLKTGNRFIKIF